MQLWFYPSLQNIRRFAFSYWSSSWSKTFSFWSCYCKELAVSSELAFRPNLRFLLCAGWQNPFLHNHSDSSGEGYQIKKLTWLLDINVRCNHDDCDMGGMMWILGVHMFLYLKYFAVKLNRGACAIRHCKMAALGTSRWPHPLWGHALGALQGTVM
jgi:hypothetical protein